MHTHDKQNVINGDLSRKRTMCKLCTKRTRKINKALNNYQIKFYSFTV